MDDDVAARKTYRYVRLGMIGAVGFLVAAILIERSKVDGCWQTSISAYYYTPARAVFVGVLLAIGLSLIVLKGSTPEEDLCLNTAGMLAPLVALVPTSDAGNCYSIPPESLPTIPNPNGDDPLQVWVIRNIENNIEAILWAGLAALVAAVVIAGIAFLVGKRRGGSDEPRLADLVNEKNRGTFLTLVGAAVMLGLVAWAAQASWFDTRSHGFAAMAMFAMLALAAALNSWQCRRLQRAKYRVIYFVIAVAMAGVACLMFIDADDWRHKVLWVEILEIIAFTAFWITQTRELWHNTVRPQP